MPDAIRKKNPIEATSQDVRPCRSHRPIHHAHVKSKTASIQPALNQESRMRLAAMIISPVVESRCVIAAAYTNEKSRRMKSNACIADGVSALFTVRRSPNDRG